MGTEREGCLAPDGSWMSWFLNFRKGSCQYFMFVLPGLPNVGVDHTSRTIKTSENHPFSYGCGGTSLLFCDTGRQWITA